MSRTDAREAITQALHDEWARVVASLTFDDAERRIRAGTAEAFGRTYARICAYPVLMLPV